MLREHGDFANGANPPNEVITTVPDFRVVRQKEKRTVLVLDTSGSMDSNDKIDKLNQVSECSLCQHVLHNNIAINIATLDINR